MKPNRRNGLLECRAVRQRGLFQQPARAPTGGALRAISALTEISYIETACKHAVEGITKSAALEAASSGVRVNAVAPGPTDTGMLDRFTGSAERKAGLAAQVPLGRVGRPDEVARAIVFVAADAASFISGQIISVDGAKSAG